MSFLRDLRYGVRLLARAPGFAAAAILTLGLGIGAATAVFSVVEGVLLRPLPYPDADRIVRLFQIDSSGRRNNNVSEPNFEDWKSGTRGFAAMAEMATWPAPAVVGRQSVILRGTQVSREFFDVMQVRPVMGRLLGEEDRHVGAAPVALVSHRVWQSQLGGGSLAGQTIRIGDVSYEIVGVMPPSFDYPPATDFWYPRELTPPQRSRTAHNFQVVARLAEGVSLPAAQSEISALSRALKARYGDSTWMSDATAIPLREQLTATSRPAVMMLFAAALLLLAIACLNVSNLLLARVATRRRELAVRLAIGAGWWRVARQLLAETTILCLAGAIAGLLIALGGVRALAVLQPSNLPRADNVQVNWTVMLFALGVSLAAAVLLTIAATLRGGDRNLGAELSESQRTSAGGRSSRHAREALSVAQVALTLVLLIGAGLLARSFVRVLTVDPGYRLDSALVLDLQAAPVADPGARPRQLRFQQEVMDRLRQLPGVEGVALVSDFPLGGGYYPNGQFLEMTRPDEIQSLADFQKLGDEAKARAGMAGFRVASEDYFRVMGIPLLRGRVFEPGDGPDAAHVAVISQSLAETKWPGQDPIGRFVQFGNMDGDLRGFRVIGVVGDVREITPEAFPGPLFYAYHQQRVVQRYSLVVRTADVSEVASAAQQIVRALDPDMPVQMRTMGEAFDRSLADRRFTLVLIAAFGTTALVLAMLGIYGLISYLVAQRTREIGIRMALGASTGELMRMILGKGMRPALVGTAVGLGAAALLAKTVEGLLFGVTSRDPVAFAAVTLLTLVAVVLATYLPAKKAVGIDPVNSLRAS